MATKLLFRAEDLDWLQARIGKRLELIAGEPHEVTTGFPHGRVLFRTAGLFDIFERQHPGAGQFSVDAGFTLAVDPATVRAPDISFFRSGRDVPGRGYPEMVPDFIVEIRSPNDSWQEIADKVEQFLARGTELAWLVQIGRFVEVHRPGQEPIRLGLEDELEAEDMLPGFRCHVRDLFPE